MIDDAYLYSKEEWNKKKLDVMQELIFQKFLIHKDLQEKLIATNKKHLEELNNWKDFFWGTDSKTGQGKNYLGKILMLTRAYFSTSTKLIS